MARYTGPVCRLCRREKMKLFLKGPKCDSMKCPIERRPYPPGMHGRGRIRESEYMFQLREKQKARRIYGVLEKQFRNMYEEANRQDGITGENLLRMLEQRLDNVAFRAGWGSSRNQARQFVRHGHVNVNGRRVTIPSYQVRKGDVVEIREKSRSMIVLRHNLDTLDRVKPPWIEVAGEGFTGHRARPAPAGAHRRPGPRVAHRRALLEVRQVSGISMLIIQRPSSKPSASRRATASSSPSRPWSPASATPWATPCAAPCCRRSRVPPSPRSASTTSSTSSPPSPG